MINELLRIFRRRRPAQENLILQGDVINGGDSISGAPLQLDTAELQRILNSFQEELARENAERLSRLRAITYTISEFPPFLSRIPLTFDYIQYIPLDFHQRRHNDQDHPTTDTPDPDIETSSTQLPDTTQIERASESIQAPEVIASVKKSILRLHEKYPLSEEILTSALTEFKRYIDRQIDSANKTHMLNAFDRILKIGEHTHTQLTFKHILALIWVAAHDRNTPAVDLAADQIPLPETYIKTREQSILDALVNVQTRSATNGESCATGTANFLVMSLNHSHPLIHIVHSRTEVMANANASVVDFVRQQFNQRPEFVREKILRQFKTTNNNADAQRFREDIIAALPNYFKDNFGLKLSSGELDSLSTFITDFPVVLLHQKLSKLLESIGNLNDIKLPERELVVITIQSKTSEIRQREVKALNDLENIYQELLIIYERFCAIENLISEFHSIENDNNIHRGSALNKLQRNAIDVFLRVDILDETSYSENTSYLINSLEAFKQLDELCKKLLSLQRAAIRNTTGSIFRASVQDNALFNAITKLVNDTYLDIAKGLSVEGSIRRLRESIKNLLPNNPQGIMLFNGQPIAKVVSDALREVVDSASPTLKERLELKF